MLFAACSRSGNPLMPTTADDPVSDQQPGFTAGTDNSADEPAPGDSDIWGMVDLTWDPASGDVASIERSADLALRHFKVSYFLNPPFCTNCITFETTSSDPVNGRADLRITLTNPTNLWGYDIRGMLRIQSGVDLSILNVDGYSSIFPVPGFQSPAPFKTFAGNLPQHQFAPSQSFSETYELETTPGADPLAFTLLVTASHPSPTGDVSTISGFRQMGTLLSGGSAELSFDIEDLQGDVTGVCVKGNPLGTGDLWMALIGDRWEGILPNNTAPAGVYDLTVEAYSPNYQNAVTSNIYRAVVFAGLDTWRNQLLAEVNADRAANGLGALTLDPLLNTAAQFHGQDMADKRFFSHYSLDGWSPWRRMGYYGISYLTAGENIAVGQDSPTEVEDAWMNSPGHKANILNSSFQKLGLGIVPCEPGDMYAPGWYWVQAFTN